MTSDTVILVTRSGPAGQALCQRLGQAGLSAVHFAPVVLAGPEDPAETRRELLAELPCDRLIAPSAEALRQTVSLIGIERLRELPLVVPGKGTAEVAGDLGFRSVFYPPQGGTSEDILALPELGQVQGLSVIILAAQGGRKTMEQQLRKRGARVSRLHVYRRLAAQKPADLEEKLLCCPRPVVLLASGGALGALESAVTVAAWSHLTSGLMIAPSRRVATLARAAGAGWVEVADGADHQAMLSALAVERRDLGVCVTLETSTR